MEEVEVLRWCVDWLARLERGENVIVNLRPDTDTETEFVRFDRPRALRVLTRITADLDELAVDRLKRLRRWQMVRRIHESSTGVVWLSLNPSQKN